MMKENKNGRKINILSCLFINNCSSGISLYKNIALERYTPIISDEIIQLYESGETDSKHNLQNDGNIRTYERLETRFGDNFSYTFSLDSK